MKRILTVITLVIIVLAIVSGTVSAQQQVMFTQYMFNGLALNPAYAGSHESISATFLFRKQWVGLEGAPNTQTLSIHSPINHERMSVGLTVMRDKIGVTRQTGVYGAYAYRIPVNAKGKLALGIQAGFSNYDANFSSVSATDNTFANADINETHPNIGFGMFYNTDRFYAGISTPQLIQSTLDDNNADSDSKILRHYFATAGYVFDLNHSLKLKPNVLFKVVDGAPVEMDLNANLLIKELVWVGVSWRSFDSFDAILQIQLTKQLQFGYAYDFLTTTDLRRVNSGSHEFMLNYRFSFSKTKVITPRYF